MVRFGRAGWEGQLVLCVVALDQILDDCAGFPDSDAIGAEVGVVNRRHAAVLATV